MADAIVNIVSTSADEGFAAYTMSQYGQPTDPVTRILNFNPGFGRDTIFVDASSYMSPGYSESPVMNPYVIKLGVGISPDDVELTMLEDVYVTASSYRYQSGWNVTWQLKLKHSADTITVVDFVASYDPSAPVSLHDQLRSLVDIEFADGTTWSAQQVLDKLKTPMPPVGTLYGSAGDDVFEPGQANNVVDLASNPGGSDTLVAWRGDGQDTVQGHLAVLSLKGGIQKSDLQFSGSGQVFVMEKGREVYRLTVDQLDSIVFDDGSTMGAAEMAAARLLGSPLDDTIQGTNQADHLTGRDGNDTLMGGSGNDTLEGNAGYNVLQGGDGDDTLISEGGRAMDTLDGGAGHDTYIIARSIGASYAQLTDSAMGDDDIVKLGLDSTEARFSILSDGALIVSSAVDYLAGGVTIKDFIGAAPDQASIGSIQFRDGVTVTAADVYKRVLQATSGDDFINGLPWADAIAGGAGNDTIYGAAGNDTLTGGAGNDSLVGGAGNDVYRYAKGDGLDFIQCDGDGAGDVLELGAGITAKDFVVISTVNDSYSTILDLVFKDGNGGIQLINHASSTGASSPAMLLTVKLADGTLLKGSDLYARRVSNVGTTGADTLWADESWQTLNGGKGNDSLIGNLSDDFLFGGDGSDTLRGGGGNDWLSGDKGNDTYLFGRGDGVDTIIDSDSTWLNSDVLRLSNITSKQLWFSQSGNDLHIDVIGTRDEVVVQNWYSDKYARVERIVASDGKTLTATKVQNLVNAMSSFAPPAQGQTTLPADTPASITKVIASNWV